MKLRWQGTLWKWGLCGGSQHLGGKLRRGTDVLGVQQMRRSGDRKTEVSGGCASLWLAGSRFVETLGIVWSPRLLPLKFQTPKRKYHLSHLRCLLIAFYQHKPKKTHIALHSGVQGLFFCIRTIWFPCWILTVPAAPMRVFKLSMRSSQIRAYQAPTSPDFSRSLLLNVVILEAKGTENTHTHLKSLTWSLKMMASSLKPPFELAS